jgi:hypothetical protein
MVRRAVWNDWKQPTQLLAELAAATDSESGESLRNAERQGRALPDDLA